ncbi:hypothetical protein GGI15_002097 [Coemansia interrupta]|uniref:Roadblock/LAMTOR2 domain-containing protein n=1 Tax=Coemansia interrupta TaxID=1126814 RepID=A0A9W8HFM3_9FUNG|nr:hypothetical protein GGI15_002097 [Coemansia interrupta]
MAQDDSKADAASLQIDIDETIARLSSKRGVESVTVLTKDGRVIRTTAEQKEGSDGEGLQGRLLSKLIRDAAEIAEQLDSQDELSFLRIRTVKRELMVALDHDYLLVVVQTPQMD